MSLIDVVFVKNFCYEVMYFFKSVVNYKKLLLGH